MKSLRFTLALLGVLYLNAGMVFAQKAQTYTTEEGKTHLCGPFPLEILQQDTSYNSWFTESYNSYQLPEKGGKWVKRLSKMEVDIYLGTWCGDSKHWVPQFVKAWEELGLDRNQLHFTALYDGSVEGKYKQGPNGEEVGKSIHRVPTFIFKEKGKEVARMVESPRNSLFTDLAQIGLGYPSEPNYLAASYMQEVLGEKSVEEIRKNYKEYFYAAYELADSPYELHTLGRVYQEAGELEKALLVLEFNSRYFTYNPYVFKRYGSLLEKMGYHDSAKQCFERVLQLNPEDEEAKAAVEKYQEEGK